MSSTTTGAIGSAYTYTGEIQTHRDVGVVRLVSPLSATLIALRRQAGARLVEWNWPLLVLLHSRSTSSGGYGSVDVVATLTDTHAVGRRNEGAQRQPVSVPGKCNSDTRVVAARTENLQRRVLATSQGYVYTVEYKHAVRG